MKRIIYIFMILTVSLVSCERSLEDTFDELELNNTIVGDDIITLTDDDYEEVGIQTTFFETIEDARELLPDFLTNRYPVWGKGD